MISLHTVCRCDKVRKLLLPLLPGGALPLPMRAVVLNLQPLQRGADGVG